MAREGEVNTAQPRRSHIEPSASEPVERQMAELRRVNLVACGLRLHGLGSKPLVVQVATDARQGNLDMEFVPQKHLRRIQMHLNVGVVLVQDVANKEAHLVLREGRRPAGALDRMDRRSV